MSRKIKIGLARTYNRMDYREQGDYLINGFFASLFTSFWSFFKPYKHTFTLNYTHTVVKDLNALWLDGRSFYRNDLDIMEIVKENLTGKVRVSILVSEMLKDVAFTKAVERTTRELSGLIDVRNKLIVKREVTFEFTDARDATRVKLILS